MELLLIRHGLPVRRELSEGIADPELAAAGHDQARHLTSYLSNEAIDAVYSSPLRRALQTAAPLAADRQLDVGVIDSVAEWDRNASTYIPIEELKAANDPRWQAMVRGEWTDHEETPEEFSARVVSALEGLIDAHAGQRIAVACHGGVINSYLAHILGLPVSQGFFYPNYTSIHRIAASARGHRSVITVNETSHLRGTGLPMGLMQQS
ncbi:MAG TPA: histidine phosphatase family protein [Ilumatobacteraceae bacterium]|nr:histidine phosphatase family protein [Ilumatobacteraceae bacterium]HRB03248.1 histidine phosphatase family protein [Ilumatobacteraceae bacterium]